MGKSYYRIHAFSFGLAIGIVWGVSILLTGLLAWATGWGEGFVETMRTGYLGYDATPLGSFFGALWGFVDGVIGGTIIAWLYNVILHLSGKKTHD